MAMSFVDQVLNGPKPLRQEILEHLAAAAAPMCCKDLFEISKAALTSRDISLDLCVMKGKGLVELTEMKEREGFRAVGFYEITAAGRDYLVAGQFEDEEESPNEPEEIPAGRGRGTGPDETQAPAPVHLPAVTQSEETQPQEASMVTKTDHQQKSKVQQMLEFIETNPDCSYADISSGTGHAYADAHLNSYLKKGQVVRWLDSERVKRYRLADGMTAESILLGKGRKTAPTATETIERPTAQVTATAAKKPAAPVRIATDPFKVAFTSEGTLLLFGLTAGMLELDRDQTSKLLELVRPHIDEVPA